MLQLSQQSQGPVLALAARSVCEVSHPSPAVAGSCGFLVLTCHFSVLSGFPESIVGNCMDRSSPGQAMQVPDHNGLGYPVRAPSSEQPRPRSLQRHHTIQNSDDAYVGASACQLRVLAQPSLALATRGSAHTPSPARGHGGAALGSPGLSALLPGGFGVLGAVLPRFWCVLCHSSRLL